MPPFFLTKGRWMDIAQLFMDLLLNKKQPMMDEPVGGKPLKEVEDGPIRKFQVMPNEDLARIYNLPQLGQQYFRDALGDLTGAQAPVVPMGSIDAKGHLIPQLREFAASRRYKM